MKESKELGSTAFAALTALAIIGLTLFYAQNNANLSRNLIKKIEIDINTDAAQLNNLSNLSMVRSLLNPARISSVLYEPAVYPLNYFDEAWTLNRNDLKPSAVSAVGRNSVTIKSFTEKPQDIHNVEPYFKPGVGVSQVKGLNQDKVLTIIRYNRDPFYYHFIRSVDVKATNLLGSTASAGNGRPIESVGRIPLEAPEPGPSYLEIAAAGTSAWSKNFGTEASPLPSGRYKLRLIASGVVLYGEIVRSNGAKIVLGMKGDEIAHKANNIHAIREEIGETIDLQLGEDKTETKTTHLPGESGAAASAHTIHNADCSFTIDRSGSIKEPSSGDPSPSPSSVSSTLVAAPIDISVKIYRVDGVESDRSFSQKIYVNSTLTTTIHSTTASSSRPGGTACRNRCPINRPTIFSHYMEFLDRSAIGSEDKTTLDVLREAESNGISRTGPGGSICGNLELAAQDVARAMGYKLPSDVKITNSKWDIFKTHAEEDGISMQLERFYAYIAPACVRQLVGFRNGCGCFAQDTKIRMADGSDQLASMVRAGDVLWNPKIGRSQSVKRVIAGPEGIPLVVLGIGGQELKVTTEHPLLTESGMRTALEIKKGDIVLSEGQALVVESVTRQAVGSAEQLPVVWNFELEGSDRDDDHYVLANGLMTGDLFLQNKLKKTMSKAKDRRDGERR